MSLQKEPTPLLFANRLNHFVPEARKSDILSGTSGFSESRRLAPDSYRCPYLDFSLDFVTEIAAINRHA
jgi:hypothetical protein